LRIDFPADTTVGAYDIQVNYEHVDLVATSPQPSTTLVEITLYRSCDV